MSMDALTQSLEELIQQLLEIGSIFLIILVAITIIPYILFGIGISSVANRYGIRHTWHAWLPIARKHLLAELADIRRAYAGKPQKLETQYEFLTCGLVASIFLISKITSPLTISIIITLIILLSYNQIFSYYYFYRLCDQENATIYFILGLLIKPLNAFLVFHCR